MEEKRIRRKKRRSTIFFGDAVALLRESYTSSCASGNYRRTEHSRNTGN